MHKLVEVSALLFAVGMTTVLYCTFLLAYFSKAKAVTICINAFGEANAELVFLTALMLFLFCVTVKKVWEAYCDGLRRT